MKDEGKSNDARGKRRARESWGKRKDQKRREESRSSFENYYHFWGLARVYRGGFCDPGDDLLDCLRIFDRSNLNLDHFYRVKMTRSRQIVKKCCIHILLLIFFWLFVFTTISRLNNEKIQIRTNLIETHVIYGKVCCTHEILKLDSG